MKINRILKKIVYAGAVFSLSLWTCFSFSVLKAEAVEQKKNTSSVKQYEASSEKNTAIKKRKLSDRITDFSDIFDSQFYMNQYPDLKQAIGNQPDALLAHFKEFGMKEGRIGKDSFHVKAYMLNNLDLVAIFKADDLTEYYVHYVESGKAEGRISTFQKGQEMAAGVLGSFTTYYDPDAMRAINVELASERINGTVLEPGKTFSFSKTVGTRTIENGYVLGPSFAGGKEVISVGGGICQVSSNLYVTMLLTGIEPTEHHYHSLPVDYVPKKLDAAISENYKDLRFKNNTQYNILIESTAKDGVLTVTLKKG